MSYPPGYPPQPQQPWPPQQQPAAPAPWPQQPQVMQPGMVPPGAQPAWPQQPTQAPQQPWPQQQQPAPGVGMYPPGGPPQPVYQPPQGVAQYHRPDDGAIDAAYKKQAAEAAQRGVGFGPKATFLKLLGPQGQVKWDASVPVGYEQTYIVWICPPWAPGRPLAIETTSHFFKSHLHPKGATLGHVDGACGFCTACIAAKGNASDAALAKRAADWGKIKRKYYYNVINLSMPQAHYGQDGVARPMVLDAGVQLHEEIGKLIGALNGATNLVDYFVGRPVRLTKKKTGPQDMDVEYSVQSASFNGPSPLPPEAYPMTHALHDLDKFVVVPTPEEVFAALQELGLSGPPQHAGYNPAPAAPYGNPYGPPAGYPNAGAPPPPPLWQPPQQPLPQPQQQQWQPPPQQAPAMQQPPPPWPQQQPPPSYPAPVGPPPMGQPPPPWTGGPGPQQQPQQPPPMAPPPLTTPAVAAPPPYLPQPSQQLPLPLQGPTAVSAPAAIAQPGPPALTGQQGVLLRLPLDPSIKLPESREKCFSRPSMADPFCQNCPDWIKTQCVAAAGTPQPQAAAQPDGLAALQRQLAGG